MEVTFTATTHKPRSQGHWLLRSIAWTLACVAGWLVASIGLATILNMNEPPGKVLLLGTAGVAHLLVWYKAVLSSPDATDTEPFWLTTVSALWTFLLLLFQVLCLLLWFLALLLTCDTSGSAWS